MPPYWIQLTASQTKSPQKEQNFACWQQKETALWGKLPHHQQKNWGIGKQHNTMATSCDFNNVLTRSQTSSPTTVLLRYESSEKQKRTIKNNIYENRLLFAQHQMRKHNIYENIQATQLAVHFCITYRSTRRKGNQPSITSLLNEQLQLVFWGEFWLHAPIHLNTMCLDIGPFQQRACNALQYLPHLGSVFPSVALAERSSPLLLPTLHRWLVSLPDDTSSDKDGELLIPVSTQSDLDDPGKVHDGSGKLARGKMNSNFFWIILYPPPESECEAKWWPKPLELF